VPFSDFVRDYETLAKIYEKVVTSHAFLLQGVPATGKSSFIYTILEKYPHEFRKVLVVVPYKEMRDWIYKELDRRDKIKLISRAEVPDCLFKFDDIILNKVVCKTCKKRRDCPFIQQIRKLSTMRSFVGICIYDIYNIFENFAEIIIFDEIDQVNSRIHLYHRKYIDDIKEIIEKTVKNEKEAKKLKKEVDKFVQDYFLPLDLNQSIFQVRPLNVEKMMNPIPSMRLDPNKKYIFISATVPLDGRHTYLFTARLVTFMEQYVGEEDSIEDMTIVTLPCIHENDYVYVLERRCWVRGRTAGTYSIYQLIKIILNFIRKELGFFEPPITSRRKRFRYLYGFLVPNTEVGKFIEKRIKELGIPNIHRWVKIVTANSRESRGLSFDSYIVFAFFWFPPLETQLDIRYELDKDNMYPVDKKLRLSCKIIHGTQLPLELRWDSMRYVIYQANVQPLFRFVRYPKETHHVFLLDLRWMEVFFAFQHIKEYLKLNRVYSSTKVTNLLEMMKFNMR